MNYLDKLDWKKVKADLEKGLNQGLAAFRTSALVVKKKAGELGDEGKRQYQILALKAKMHKGMTDLGARVYALVHSRKNPLLDSRVKDIVAQISKSEATILALERVAGKKTSPKTRRKTASTASSRARKR